MSHDGTAFCLKGSGGLFVAPMWISIRHIPFQKARVDAADGLNVQVLAVIAMLSVPPPFSRPRYAQKATGRVSGQDGGKQEGQDMTDDDRKDFDLGYSNSISECARFLSY